MKEQAIETYTDRHRHTLTLTDRQRFGQRLKETDKQTDSKAEFRDKDRKAGNYREKCFAFMEVEASAGFVQG